MYHTTVIWRKPIPPATVEILRNKLIELSPIEPRYVTFTDVDENTLTVVRGWDDIETAQAWADFCESITDYFISVTVE